MMKQQQEKQQFNLDEGHDVCGTGRRKSYRQIRREQNIVAGILVVFVFLLLVVSLAVVAVELTRAETTILMLEEECVWKNNNNSTRTLL